MAEMSGVSPALLIDDISAEMDDKMLKRAVDSLMEIGSQCFFTAIRSGDLQSLLPAETHVFHVERKFH